MIYEWASPPYEKYASYIGKSEKDEAAITWYSPVLGTPLPPLSQWETPTLVQFIGENGNKIPKIISDCVSSSSIRLINQKAVDALKDIWDKHATLHPVILEDKADESYYMVVHTLIDCLDREKFIGSKFDEQTERGKKGYFTSIIEWVMCEEEIGDNELFVLPDKPTPIYLTETFKQRVLAAGLTGFGFTETRYFDDKPFIT